MSQENVEIKNEREERIDKEARQLIGEAHDAMLEVNCKATTAYFAVLLEAVAALKVDIQDLKAGLSNDN